MNLISTVEYLNKYVFLRLSKIKEKTKKITPAIFKEEVIGARLLGELSGAEKVLEAIVQNKHWDREFIEAELHVYIAELNNMACDYLSSNAKVDVGDILESYGYYGENNVKK